MKIALELNKLNNTILYLVFLPPGQRNTFFLFTISDATIHHQNNSLNIYSRNTMRLT